MWEQGQCEGSQPSAAGPSAHRFLPTHLEQAAKMPFSIHPHMLHHACGFKLMNDGHDTRALQQYVTGIFVCARAASGPRSAVSLPTA
jgi:hypothetical protein